MSKSEEFPHSMVSSELVYAACRAHFMRAEQANWLFSCPCKEQAQPQESFSLSLQVNKTADAIRKSKTGREMLIYSTVRHSYWEGKIGRQIMKERMIGLNWFKSYTMSYEAPSLAIGSVLWERTGTETVEREGRLACSWAAEKKREDCDDYWINFFYTDQQSAAIQAATLRSLGNLVASVTKKQNSTGQLPYFIVNRHPLLFLKSFRALSSIHYNTHAILVIKEALTRGALEIPWWFTPNRVNSRTL